MGQKRVSNPVRSELRTLCYIIWVLGINSGPLEGQPVFLTAEPPLQLPHQLIFNIMLLRCNFYTVTISLSGLRF